MKGLKSIIFSSLAVMALACNPRQEINDLDPATSGKGAITFDLSLASYNHPRAILRADEEILRDKAMLNTINGLRVVLYKDNDQGEPGEVAYAFNKDVNAFRGERKGADLLNPDDTAGIFSITGIDGIEPANYTLYFFATPTRALIQATQPGKDFAEIKRPLMIDFTDKFVTGEDMGFHTVLYSSASNIDSPVKVSEGDLFKSVASNPIKLGGIKLKALDGIAIVKLDIDQAKQASSGVIIGKEKHYFYPDVLNKSVILFPELDKDEEKNLSIPKDDNYDGMEGWSETQLAEAFQYNHIMDDCKTNILINDQESFTDPIILPENTTAPDLLSNRVVTRIVARLNVMPTSQEEGFAIEDKSSWFSYKGKNYSWKKFEKKYTAAATAKKNGSTTTKEEKTLLEIGLAINKALNKGSIEPKYGDELPDVPANGYNSKDLKIYKLGFSYFSIPIRHYSDEIAQSLKTIGRYGIVRNTLYLISITSITRIGAPTYESLPKETNYAAAVTSDLSIDFEDRNLIKNEVDL